MSPAQQQFSLDQLLGLSAVVSEGSFEAAARKLHVTPSAISQRIKALETTVGRVLLTRSKPVRPTESGITLLRGARQIEAVAAELALEFTDSGQEPSTITLAVNADSLSTWFLPALAAVDPPLAFDLRRADETRTADLLRDGTAMAAVTASAQPVAGCVVRRLGRMRYRPRASERFAARWFPQGPTPTALAQAPVIAFDRGDHLEERYSRRRTRRRLDPPRHYVPSSDAFAHAVRLGLGWGMVPELQVPPGNDELIDLDPQGAIDVPLFWQQWRLHSVPLDRVAAAVQRSAQELLR
jgi:LysR family transcriptional regulator (chromosome initiation inhibitor)